MRPFYFEIDTGMQDLVAMDRNADSPPVPENICAFSSDVAVEKLHRFRVF